MGKLILVLGANNSGKSDHAEKIIDSTGTLTQNDRFYIATMIPRTQENHSRIEKHIRRRKKYGFRTIEEPYYLKEVSVSENSAVLLEDISNLLANNIFEKGLSENDVFEDVRDLVKRAGTVVVVSISGLERGEYDEGTNNYIDSLNSLNKRLSDIADNVIEMREGEPYDIT